MSGSSGGSSFGGGGPQQECSDITILTQLASPVPDVVKDLEKGDILGISLVSPTGPLRAKTHDGAIAGAILTADPGILINCINEGYVFAARVFEKNGGDCKISIYCTGKP